MKVAEKARAVAACRLKRTTMRSRSAAHGFAPRLRTDLAVQGFASRSVASRLRTDLAVQGSASRHFSPRSEARLISTAYVLPGDSGSPVLNDEGEIVGLLHRSPSLQDSFTSQGVNTESIATASANIVAALNTPLRVPERAHECGAGE